MQNFKKAEILAPAGNMEMLIAAVRSGAGAIYLGAEEFSARRNAQNFSLSELQEAVKYCHIRGVKVYLALNITIKDRELEKAYGLAQFAYNCGIDGIIVQDIGLANILHRNIPNLKLHASTQMSIHSPAALKILKEMGFCQVVAAREMSKKELSALCEEAKKLDIVVEVFVHGALCMSVSGQCLLSAFLGSRSGNRGLCAGPCRLPFAAQNGTGYDVSLKDLSLLKYLVELYEMGVGSFKIEGRMKRPEYVAAATAACKQALYSGYVEKELENTLKGVFSRSGFTAGYYENRLGKDMFGIRTKEDVAAAKDAFPFLHELYRNEPKRVAVALKAEILKDKPIRLSLSDNENHFVSVEGEIPAKAKSKPLSYEGALKNLCKFGNTPYFSENVTIDLDDELFVSSGELNELRRNACALLDEKRALVERKQNNISYKFEKLAPNNFSSPKFIARFSNAQQIPEDISFLSAIVLPLEENPDTVNNLKLPLIIDIPRGISDEQKLFERLLLFKKKGFSAAFCGNLSLIPIVIKAGLIPLGDTGLNLANSEALEVANLLNLRAALISAEQTIEDINALSSNIPKGIIAYGSIPLMLFKNCPLKNGISCSSCNKNGCLVDRKGVEFPVNCRGGYSELYNSLPIWLADRKEELSSLDFALLYFTRETPERVAEVISAYKNGAEPDVKHTRGLYYRGTI